MKIEGVGTAATRSVKRNSGKKTAKGQGDFSTHTPASVASSQGGSEMPSVQGVDSLLATQEMPEKQWKRRQSYQRGQEILEDLDRLRLEILSGGVPLSRLKTLKQQLKKHDVDPGDAELQEICNMIEQRLAIEVAKLEQVRGA